ncbi:MAG TPA: phosphotransferase [Thermoanaerobaculaceae bacterium]|nr:phosphotransferase [Thermoanaerobaculaceae bacterium]HRS16888.1 phosphotransferase [Thermoanaerobaculaceae bacterium]
MREERDVAQALAAYPLRVRGLERVSSGHINLTFRVEADEGPFILQRLHPVFGPEVHVDIEAVTAHLAARGLTTPRLVRTRDGELWTPGPDGRPWRVLTCIPGRVVLAAESPARCAAAGACLGRVHRALWDFEHPFAHRRVGVHDTLRHLARLRAALAEHRDHRLFHEIEPLAAAILAAAEKLALPAELPLRVVHGDPKISNFVFADDGSARAMIDLDTFSRMALPLEIGDALRSWCSPRGEESTEPVDIDHFRAAIEGYATAVGDLPTTLEREATPLATALIAVELAARFCTDALEERYFAWDSSRFPSATEHNLVRARAQLVFGHSVLSRLPALQEIVRAAW